ncbi:MAG: CoA transferase [Burkholderiaceae bacterium]|nr:CoA transferase [Burkholderiaceae bacterium]
MQPGENPMGVLDSLQVVDLSQGIAGPIAGMFMADFGAEVVKVEPPQGDPGRDTPGFSMWNRGKKSVIVDPADAAQCRWLGDLIAGADICIVRDGATLEAYGLSGEALRARNARLIVVELAPYGRTTPWLGGHESQALLAAAGGVAWRQSGTDGGPIDSVYPHLLYVQGVWATVCTVAALIERERSGYGQGVCVTGINAVMEAAVGALTVNPDNPDPGTAVGTGGRHPTYTRYATKDGQWIACGALGGKFETWLIKALGLGGMLDEERMAGNIGNLVLATNVDWAKAKIQAEFLKHDLDELIAMITELGIPCGRIGPTEAWLDHPQVKAIGMHAQVHDPRRGPTSMPGIPINLTRTPGKVQGPAPALGAHTGQVRARPAPPRPDKMALLRPGPLAGYRILDMGTFVAGPYCGSLLAELGADVIKVEPLTGDPFRATGYTFNRGMRSVAMDLQNPQAREAFYEMVKTSDVVIDSLRPGVTKNLGIHFDTLDSLKHGMVTVSLSAYGEGGPLSQLPGVDMVLQAMSGMMTSQGGKDEPVANTIAIIDVTTAATCVLSSVLGLYHRERTGEGQRIWNSLAATATYLQSEELVRYEGRPALVKGSENHRGPGWLDRFYATNDGWVRVQAADPGRITPQGLIQAGLVLGASQDPIAALAQALAPLSGAEAVQRLAVAGVAATRARRVSEVLRDPDLSRDEFVHVRAASDGTYFTTPGRYASFSRTQRSGPMRVAGIGEHAVDVLGSAGLAKEQIDALAKSGAIVIGAPMEQKLMPSYR